MDKEKVSINIGKHLECGCCLQESSNLGILQPCFHNICFECFEKVSDCPFCRKRIQSIGKNFILENICEELIKDYPKTEQDKLIQNKKIPTKNIQFKKQISNQVNQESNLDKVGTSFIYSIFLASPLLFIGLVTLSVFGMVKTQYDNELENTCSITSIIINDAQIDTSTGIFMVQWNVVTKEMSNEIIQKAFGYVEDGKAALNIYKTNTTHNCYETKYEISFRQKEIDEWHWERQTGDPTVLEYIFIISFVIALFIFILSIFYFLGKYCNKH